MVELIYVLTYVDICVCLYTRVHIKIRTNDTLDCWGLVQARLWDMRYRRTHTRTHAHRDTHADTDAKNKMEHFCSGTFLFWSCLGNNHCMCV